MMKKTNIGIIICDRYHNCAEGKCFSAMRNEERALVSTRTQKQNWVNKSLGGQGA